MNSLCCICNSFWMCTLSVSLRPEQVACEAFPPSERLLPAKTFCAMVSPPHPTVSPTVSPKGCGHPPPIVFYLTEMYKCQHILLSGRPFSKHQLRGGLLSTPKINYRD